MQKFNIQRIIDEFDDESFRCCKALIRPILLKDELIDKEKEQWVQLIKNKLRIPGADLRAPLGKYAELLCGVDRAYFVFKDESGKRLPKTEAYKKRMLSLIKGLNDSETQIDDAESVVKIFLSFMRCWMPEFDLKKNLKEFDFELSRSDEQVVQLLAKQKLRYYRLHKEFFGMVNSKKREHMTTTELRYFYVMTVLIYCRIMQYERENTWRMDYADSSSDAE